MFKNEEGFSLLELVVAVGVAGIIAAVALPTFAGIQDKATTTSATYAASASAAEALANSTMGLTGGNGSASTTGGASSSQASNAVTLTTGSSDLFRDEAFSWIGGSYIYTSNSEIKGLGSAVVGETVPESEYWTWENVKFGAATQGGSVGFDSVSLAKAQEIVNFANNATSITVDGVTYNLVNKAALQYNYTYGNYTVTYVKAQYYDNYYGGYGVRIYVSQPLSWNMYNNPVTVTITQ